jgi:hypothetical protein
VITVRVLEVTEVLETTLRRVQGVRDVQTDRNRKTLSFATDDIPGTNPVVVRRLCEAGASVLSVEVGGATLEQAYLRLIGSGPGEPP